MESVSKDRGRNGATKQKVSTHVRLSIGSFEITSLLLNSKRIN